MGIDYLDMVFRAQRKFGVRFPSPDRPDSIFNVECKGDLKLLTAGAVHRHVLRLLPSQAIVNPLRTDRDWREAHPEEVWEAVVDVLVETLGVERSRVTPEARLIDDLGMD
jgi:acyl carrier protein